MRIVLTKIFIVSILLGSVVDVFAEGTVPLRQGYVYEVGRCGLAGPPYGGKGASPDQAYRAACRDSISFDRKPECTSQLTQTFGGLGAQTTAWMGAGQEWAYFDSAYTRRITYRTTPGYTADFCWKYNQTINGKSSIQVYRESGLSCPNNATLTREKSCQCNQGYRPDKTGNNCIPYFDRLHDTPQRCEAAFGDPIFPLTGSNTLEIGLGNWFGEPASLKYDSRGNQPNGSTFSSYWHASPPSFGAGWNGNYHKRVAAPVLMDTGTAQVGRGQGRWVSFLNTNGVFTPDPGVSDTLVRTAAGWIYRDVRAGVIETYDNFGRIVSAVRIGGGRLDYSYDESMPSLNTVAGTGLIKQVTDGFGRKVVFTYQAPGYIEYLTDTAGRQTFFEYDADGNLTLIRWPDDTYREFVYHPQFRWALTGVIDENRAQTTTFGYDSEGRAYLTEQAGGVNRYTASYSTPPVWAVTETPGQTDSYVWRDYSWVAPQGISVTGPNGESTNLSASLVQGTPRVSTRSQPAGSGCDASNSSVGYDVNGNKSWADDFNGYRTCNAHELSRNLETSRVEGLPSGTACAAVLANGAALPAGARKISTQWHPDWHRQAKVARPKLLTTFVYNGQLDPFTNQVAACAPDAPALPDGKPVVVLCKQVEQVTTDASGRQGMSAALDTTAPMRVRQWAYNAAGQVLSYTDPLEQTTTYAYYADTSADHTAGDLSTVTNAKQQVTRYTKYSLAGDWLEMQDANNVLTTRVFDSRQRLQSVTTEGRVIVYDYWPTGLLKKVTLPDSSLNFGYDDAHRLKSITDNLGNSVTYTLDNSGNRTGEETRDPSGNLGRTLARVPDALNRIQQVTGRP